MADSFQSGTVTTLHNIVDRPLEELEADLLRFSKSRGLGLILPSLFSELEQDALKNIVNELQQVNYLNAITIGLDQADERQFRYSLKYFAKLPQGVNILWNDGPRLKRIDALLKEAKLSPTQMGKGRNVWYCMGYTLGLQDVEAVALHDCDIKTYH